MENDDIIMIGERYDDFPAMASTDSWSYAWSLWNVSIGRVGSHVTLGCVDQIRANLTAAAGYWTHWPQAAYVVWHLGFDTVKTKDYSLVLVHTQTSSHFYVARLLIFCYIVVYLTPERKTQ